ncbi:MAG: U32 family peptidase [Methanothrix sp.]|nr:U32 family peptidase [Methanothrix sp.]
MPPSARRRLPELLAPAGSDQALKAAVAAGADAVYLGGRRFGARKFASNFDLPDLARAVDYAHLQGVKVYVTVNTLVREDEIPGLAEYLLCLYEIGADALLLQDLGAAFLAKSIVPELERHASTQMTIHNGEGARWAGKAGFSRVVLAREVGLVQIKEMSRDGGTGNVGLEVFIHGALCYSYSGQCLLSSAIGGRSGNRGMCAQPCRKPYVLLSGQKDRYGRPVGLSARPMPEKYLLSTRDLCVYRHLKEIVRSPLASLKIEGRMKSPEYVAIVTSIYRRALDGIARGDWSPSDEDEMALALAFNRSFTKGHLLGEKDVMGREMSDNRGVLIGSVSSYDSRKGEAAVRLSGSLTAERGDGLVFQSPGHEVGLVVQRTEVKDGLLRLKMKEKVRPGARVYLTGSTALSRKAAQIIESAPGGIPLDLYLSWQEDRPLLQARLPDGKKVAVLASFLMEKAKNQPLTRQQIESQLSRTGGTAFAIRKIEMDYSGDLFAPLGALNQLRRQLLEKVEQALLAGRRPEKEKVEEARARWQEMLYLMPGPSCGASSSPPTRKTAAASFLSVYAASLEEVRGAVAGGCDRIYLEPSLGRGIKDDAEREAGFRKILSEARAICGSKQLIWKWPRICRSEFFSLACRVLAGAEVEGVLVENVGALQAALECQPALSIYGGMGLNVCNHLAVRALTPSLCHFTLSPELSARQMAAAISASRLLPQQPSLELVVQGSLEVMVAEDCIPCLAGQHAAADDSEQFWGLQDMRRVFPLRLDDDSRIHIFNSVETCLLDQMPRIAAMGLDGIALDGRSRGGEYARRMTEIYRRAIELTERGRERLEQDLQALKEEALPLALGGITYGHFVKGLRDEID